MMRLSHEGESFPPWVLTLSSRYKYRQKYTYKYRTNTYANTDKMFVKIQAFHVMMWLSHKGESHPPWDVTLRCRGRQSKGYTTSKCTQCVPLRIFSGYFETNALGQPQGPMGCHFALLDETRQEKVYQRFFGIILNWKFSSVLCLWY